MPSAQKAGALAEASGAAETRCDAEILARAVAELERLDAASLRRRWRALVGGAMPPDLGRPLMLRLLAYKLQAQRLGDLDKVSARELSDIYDRSRGRRSADDYKRASPPEDREAPDAFASRPTGVARRIARPGTVLTREYGGVLHRVMVLDKGVSWNGQTYDSLSKVAAAITGTKWNGPRFFGLRDRAVTSATDGACDRAVRARKVGPGRMPAAGSPGSSAQRAPS